MAWVVAVMRLCPWTCAVFLAIVWRFGGLWMGPWAPAALQSQQQRAARAALRDTTKQSKVWNRDMALMSLNVLSLEPGVALVESP